MLGLEIGQELESLRNNIDDLEERHEELYMRIQQTKEESKQIRVMIDYLKAKFDRIEEKLHNF
jgi:peptidoglycan hydrolase CwlO-like protein